MTQTRQIAGKVVESQMCKGAFKVWVQTPTATGYLRQGHAWKSKAGAEKALAQFLRNYPIKCI